MLQFTCYLSLTVLIRAVRFQVMAVPTRTEAAIAAWRHGCGPASPLITVMTHHDDAFLLGCLFGRSCGSGLVSMSEFWWKPGPRLHLFRPARTNRVVCGSQQSWSRGSVFVESAFLSYSKTTVLQRRCFHIYCHFAAVGEIDFPQTPLRYHITLLLPVHTNF